MSTHLVELFAILAATTFTGAAVYVTAVEHPARLSCGTEIAATEWVPSYKRAAVMQASLAILAALFGMIRAMQDGGSLWWWAAAIIVAVVPFTLIVIRPTNDRLLDPRLDRRSAEALRLLRTWGRQHAVRSGAGIAASILFVWAAIR
jgi:hypothetical protein